MPTRQLSQHEAVEESIIEAQFRPKLVRFTGALLILGTLLFGLATYQEVFHLKHAEDLFILIAFDLVVWLMLVVAPILVLHVLLFQGARLWRRSDRSKPGP